MAQARLAANKMKKKSTQGAGFKEKNPANHTSPQQTQQKEHTFAQQEEAAKGPIGKSFQEDEDLNMSDLEEDQRRELLELEMQIENENLTRGERRRL
jgi:hypothetical protein